MGASGDEVGIGAKVGALIQVGVELDATKSGLSKLGDAAKEVKDEFFVPPPPPPPPPPRPPDDQQQGGGS